MKKVDEGMSTQEIFNKVYLGLKSQGFQQSWDSTLEQCAYRGDDGMKCAAGWLIPDEVYTPEIEGCSVGIHSQRLENRLDPSDLFEEKFFVSELQSIHDRCRDSMQMRVNLELFAKERGLEVPK